MNQSTSKTLRAEVVAEHIQVVVVFWLPTYQHAASQIIHNEKFSFLGLSLFHDAYASLMATTTVSFKWGRPLWSYVPSGVLLSLTKLLQYYAAPWRPGWRAQWFNIPRKVCFHSMENTRINNASFPFSTWLSFYSCMKGKVWFNLNMRATLMWKKEIWC